MVGWFGQSHSWTRERQYTRRVQQVLTKWHNSPSSVSGRKSALPGFIGTCCFSQLKKRLTVFFCYERKQLERMFMTAFVHIFQTLFLVGPLIHFFFWWMDFWYGSHFPYNQLFGRHSHFATWIRVVQEDDIPEHASICMWWVRNIESGNCLYRSHEELVTVVHHIHNNTGDRDESDGLAIHNKEKKQ